jgi:DNA polymerase III subunit gamma/tau
MSYQVIARKYRPQRFADVVGQEHVTQTLINAIQQNRIAHAYLFAGPRGTGKTTIARIFAMCLNCTGGPKVDFPADDPRCLEISEGRSLDVLEIDGASNRGIEEIRALRDTVKYAPATGKFKIYIIDEVHMLTKEAFNALLKTLEEPPAHVKFMFATTEPEKMLPTILSRCQRYDLRRIPANRIAQHLGYIAGEEKVEIDEAARQAIARGAEGCMRDAESTLDQLISFCGQRIEEGDVLSMFGLTARGQIQQLAGILLNGEAEAVLATLQVLEKNGKDLSRLLSDLLEHFRNLLLYLIGKGNLGLLEVTDTEAAILKGQAGGTTIDVVTRIMETLADGENRIRDAISKKIYVEVTLLKAMQARHAVSLDSVLEQLTRLRQSGAEAKAGAPSPAGVLAAPLPARKPASASPKVEMTPAVLKEEGIPAGIPSEGHAALAAARTPSESGLAAKTPMGFEPAAKTPVGVAGTAGAAPKAEEAGKGSAALEFEALKPAEKPHSVGDDLESIWQRTVEAVGQTSQFTRTYLLQGHPMSLVKNVLTIGYLPENVGHIDLVDNAKNRSLIQAKLRELGLGEIQVKIVKTDKAPPAAASQPGEAAKPSTAGTPVEARTGPAPAPAPAEVVKKPARKAPEVKPESAGAKPEGKGEAKLPTVVLNKEDFKNDPLIKQALEIFKGQILEIRGPSEA